MRLLYHTSTGQLRLTKDLLPDQIPRYAILSHTWGKDGEEVTFQDLENNTGEHKPGYKKIRFCAEQARRNGLQYFWVDTCCINKANLTELAYSINSMFRWYQNAVKCYVYLADVSIGPCDQGDLSANSWQLAFSRSHWFTRGWTLQELIAPSSVEFFDLHGQRLGDKKSLERQISEITGIAISALQGTPLSTFTQSEKMSWTQNRQTKREEDRAYSLLGIFDVSMTPNYGEGAQHAFERLQDELYKRWKKHAREELGPVSDTFNIAKRPRTSQSRSSSFPAGLVPNAVDSEPFPFRGYPVDDGQYGSRFRIIKC